jgi:hypothetical protein
MCYDLFMTRFPGHSVTFDSYHRTMSRQRNGYSPTSFEELDVLLHDYLRLRYLKNFFFFVMFELKLYMLYLVLSKMALNCYILDC